MDIGAALITDGQAAVAAEPSECTLDHPAVAAQAGAALNASSGDAGDDTPSLTGLSAVRKVISLVRMEFGPTSALCALPAVEGRGKSGFLARSLEMWC